MMSLVLIADEDNENRYLVEVLLKTKGFDTLSATNGKEALDMAHGRKPDLICSDVLMPVMDGFTLCRQWMADENLKSIPFIFYTAAYTEPKDVEFGLSLGAMRYLIKPQEIDLLLKIICDVMAESGEKKCLTPGGAVEDEMKFLRFQNKTLFRKLEKKIANLEAANSAFQQEFEKRKITENSLRESEKKLRAILDALPIGIAETDQDGRIRYVNERFIELFGYGKGDATLIKDCLYRACSNRIERESFLSSWGEAMKTARRARTVTTPFEIRIPCKDGSFLDVSVVGIIIGNLSFAVFVDITEQKKLQEQLL
jgi:hypothetical protein